MLIRVGLEAIAQARSLAWGLDFPGCFAYGSSDAEAMLCFAASLINFEHWVSLHTEQPWFRLANVDFRIVEVYPGSVLPGLGATPTAFFEDDKRPLSHEEIDHVLQVFRWQREELLAGLEFWPMTLPMGKNSGLEQVVIEVMRDIARTEYDVLERFALELPAYPNAAEPLTALQFSQDLVEKVLPGLAKDTQIIEKKGEIWSSRKLARRLLWLQRVQIDKLKALIENPGA